MFILYQLTITRNCKNVFYYVSNTAVGLWWSHQYGRHWLHLFIADALSSPSFQISGLYMCACLSVNMVIQKITNILRQHFAHTFAIAQGGVDQILVYFGWELWNKFTKLKSFCVIFTKEELAGRPSIQSQYSIALAARAVARGGRGGGCIFIYSCYARRISFEISCF